MTQGFQRFTKRYVNVLGVLIGLAVVSSILLYSGCGMTSSPNTPTSPTPTPTPTPAPDTSAPLSEITFPKAGASLVRGTTSNISGFARDTGGGTVVRVEVSVDGGATYSPATLSTGTDIWGYTWTPTSLGQVMIKSRAVDNSGNQQDPPAQINVTVTATDTTPPEVIRISPITGQNEVSIFENVTAFFTEELDPATVNETTVQLRDQSGALVPATVSYSRREAVLNPIDPLVRETTYIVVVKGGDTDPRVKDPAGNALSTDATSTFTTTVPPQVLSVTPAPGATDIPVGVAPRIRFSKVPRDVGIQMHDSAGNSVPLDFLSRSLDFTVMLLPEVMLQPMQTYTVTVTGVLEAPFVTDSSVTPLESDFTWSFTTGVTPPPIPTFSIFAPTVTPNNPISDDSMATEVGMKFRTDVNGFITDLRYYRGGTESGPNAQGTLWAGDGTLLGSTFFSTGPNVGWHQSDFWTPIPITANTTYIASYFARLGRYAEDQRFFESSGVDNGPLHALRNGFDGGNGVFLHSSNGGFPTDTSMSSNYYVDVVFSPTISPPQVLSTMPKRATSLPVGGGPNTISFTFTEAIDPASVNESTVFLTDISNNPVPFTISFDSGNFTVRLTANLSIFVEAYTVTLKGGVGEPHITNATGTPLAVDYTWSFTTILRLGPPIGLVHEKF